MNFSCALHVHVLTRFRHAAIGYQRLAALTKEASSAQQDISTQGELLIMSDPIAGTSGLVITSVAGTVIGALDPEQQVSGDEAHIRAGTQERQEEQQYSADSWGSLYRDPYLNSPPPADTVMEDLLVASSTMATSAVLPPGGGNFY